MMDTKEYAYARARYLLDEPIGQLFPEHVIDRLGVGLGYEQGEIVIKLHLKPIHESANLLPGSYTQHPSPPHALGDTEDGCLLGNAYLRQFK